MHESDTLLFELFAIFVAAKVIGEIFERLKLPAVLGEILAGVLIGPYALGWIHPSATLKAIAKSEQSLSCFTPASKSVL
jgi:Kef-type K+ transport system membrane component KefB